MRKEDTQRQRRHKEEYPVKMEREIAVTLSHAKEPKDCWSPSELGGKHGTDSFSEPPTPQPVPYKRQAALLTP